MTAINFRRGVGMVSALRTIRAIALAWTIAPAAAHVMVDPSKFSEACFSYATIVDDMVRMADMHGMASLSDGGAALLYFSEGRVPMVYSHDGTGRAFEGIPRDAKAALARNIIAYLRAHPAVISHHSLRIDVDFFNTVERDCENYGTLDFIQNAGPDHY